MINHRAEAESEIEVTFEDERIRANGAGGMPRTGAPAGDGRMLRVYARRLADR
jgi:hypothetical protein